MSDIPETVRPDVAPASIQHLDGLDPLAAYLHALEATVTALERRLCAFPLMTAADAARHAQVNVETILRAVRAGELPVIGYIARSPRISRDALNRWLAAGSSAAAGVSTAPPPPAAKGKRCRRGGMASAALNVAPGRSPRPAPSSRADGPDGAPKIAPGAHRLEGAAPRLRSVRA